MSHLPIGARSRHRGLRAIYLSAAVASCVAWAGASQDAWSANAQAPAAVGQTAQASVSIDPAVTAALAANESPAVLVKFRGKADLSAAFDIHDRTARAAYVHDTLTQFAANAQVSARQTLQGQYGLSEDNRGYTVLWVANSIAIAHLTQPMLQSLASSSEVESIRAQRVIDLPKEEVEPLSGPQLEAVVASVTRIKAPDVWALGYKGDGIVLANIDAGVRYTHAALVNQYRGNLGGGTFNHAFNWYDPYNHAAAPRYTDPHGSHTMGTMVGDNGTTEQIGVAPGAKWIACIGFGLSGAGATDAGLLECGQWMIAPTDVTGAAGTADPSKHPDVVNNSWGDCGQSYDNWYETVIDGWIAAGIAPVFSNGNASNCGYPNNPPLNTVGNPARSGKVLGIGSTGNTNGQYAAHSNKGPTDNPNPGGATLPDARGFADLKPNLSAPGVSIRSSISTSDTAYGGMSGTSMSAPAVTGVIGLMWNAASCLHGDYAHTGTILMETANAVPVATGSPSDGPGNVPNQATGWGEVDALAAVNAGIAYCAASALPSVAKAFSPANVSANADSAATVTLTNPKTVAATLTADLVDTLPAGLVATAASTTCAGTASFTPGSFKLASGATIPASGSCTITATVHSATDGNYVNTIAADALQTNQGNNPTAASATLTVGAPVPAASVTPSALTVTAAAGSSTTTPLTIANVGGGSLTYAVTESAAGRASPTSFRNSRDAKAKGVLGVGTLSMNPNAGHGQQGHAVTLNATDISQMADNTPGDEGVSCGTQSTSTADNSWWRRFYFNEHPAVGASTAVSSVTVSTGSIDVGGLPVTVNLYTLAHSTAADTIPTGSLTLIGTATGTLTGSLQSITIPVTGSVADTVGSDLVVEIHTDGNTSGGQFFPGANASTETHPTFLSSATCGISDPTTASAIGFPDFHLTMVVTLDGDAPVAGCQNPSDVPWLSETPTSGTVAPGANTDVAVTANAAGLSAGTYSANLCVATNDPTQALITVPVSLTVTMPAFVPCNGGSDEIFCDGFDPAGSDEPFEQPLQDPSFEATTTDAGSNPFWAGTDSNDPNGGTPFYSASGFEIDVHTGDWEAWFGGWRATSETQTFSQSVTIASGGPRFINYWRNVVAAPVGTATLKVYVDGTAVATTDITANGEDAGWTNVSVDISTYADNASHEIKFEYTTAGSDDGNVFIDDVTIDEQAGSARSSR